MQLRIAERLHQPPPTPLEGSLMPRREPRVPHFSSCPSTHHHKHSISQCVLCSSAPVSILADSSHTQQCTPRRPENTHRMFSKPKSSRSPRSMICSSGRTPRLHINLSQVAIAAGSVPMIAVPRFQAARGGGGGGYRDGDGHQRPAAFANGPGAAAGPYIVVVRHVNVKDELPLNRVEHAVRPQACRQNESLAEARRGRCPVR